STVSPYMLGLINRRGKVMWVLDLSQMLGLKCMEFIPRNYSALVIKVGTFLSALAVHQIDGISRIDKNTIGMVPNYISATLVPYLEGCVLQDKSVSLVLDIEAIAHSSLLQLNP
ncbi:MAG: chemotaxis protein CheW, partial [Merismopedia sp. SIO2A8]|nr:chemotaxis protein CheW [Merismopedia sp. SIO2A8]